MAGKCSGSGRVRQFPIALSYEARMYASQWLKHILADSQILHALTRSITG
jgi:starvation-inducible DNA-binding protein